MFFTAADYNFTSNIEFHRRIPAELGEDGDGAAKRRRALKLVDRALSKRQYKTALSLVKQLQGKPGGLRAFGAAKQITKGLSSVHEFELNGNNLLSLQPLVDSILDSIQQCTQISLLDEISAEKLESLIAGSGHSSRYEEEHLICAEHEAGHFLVGYLLGVLPREYEVPSIQTLSQNRFAEGKVSFVGFEFLGEIDSFKILSENADMRKFRNRAANNGRISLKTLKQFSCVTLGGLVAELLVAGNSDGHLADILKVSTPGQLYVPLNSPFAFSTTSFLSHLHQLESVLRWLGLSKANADLHLKWAATNTVFVLSRHCETRSRLAEAMALGKPIGICIDTIENCLQGREI
ncbi:uncharacterized protein LOC111021838 [Momordica charantia]|uniref:Uncharacterized protein LOC111021838 n=1 Tax=Momordica charantia TaxID=3673 RepID=A0A6J1DM53_MOMCH|nr:uncharacterized protein LOC111021838 [Momordica charantia]